MSASPYRAALAALDTAEALALLVRADVVFSPDLPRAAKRWRKVVARLRRHVETEGPSLPGGNVYNLRLGPKPSPMARTLALLADALEAAAADAVEPAR